MSTSGSPTTNATSRDPHSSSGTPSTSTSQSPGCSRAQRDRRRRDVDAAGDHHVVEPAEDLEPAVLVDPGGVLGAEPAVDERPRRELQVAVVPVEQHRPRDAQPPSFRRWPAPRRRARPRRRRSRRPSPPSRTSRPRFTPASVAQLRSAGSIGPPPSSTAERVRSARTSSASSSMRCSWVGTSETYAGAAGLDGGRQRRVVVEQHRRLAGQRRERQTTCAPATYDAGRASSQRPSPSSRRAVAAPTRAPRGGTARTRFGVPLEPEVSTTSGSSSDGLHPRRQRGHDLGRRPPGKIHATKAAAPGWLR